jgi:UDPglucose--hexose-1-phosphate uridylyltransferase
MEAWRDRVRELSTHTYIRHIAPFENRGEEVGVTLFHPHGQIYAFDHVPSRQQRQLDAQWSPELVSGDREVLVHNGWKVWTEFASVHPVSLRIAPLTQVADLPSMTDAQRSDLADVLARVFGAFETLFDAPAPYMMWLNQSPRTTTNWPQAWFNIEIVSPWRTTGVPRYIAAVEVASEEYFNPVDPADVAQRLRIALT